MGIYLPLPQMHRHLILRRARNLLLQIPSLLISTMRALHFINDNLRILTTSQKHTYSTPSPDPYTATAADYYYPNTANAS